jgi:hypothetical protein
MGRLDHIVVGFRIAPRLGGDDRDRFVSGDNQSAT